MDYNERHQKIAEILAKFKNGEGLYRTNALFNQSVQMMVNGITPYEALENVILANERIQRAFEDYIKTDKRGVLFEIK